LCQGRIAETCGAVALSLVLVTTTDAQPSAVKPSAVTCDHYAHNLAQQRGAQGQMLGGAAAGSLVGLGIGALFAASGVGAAIGATAGLVGGGAKRQQRAQQIYAAAYQDCMAGRVR
jgi:hypothetical protein